VEELGKSRSSRTLWKSPFRRKVIELFARNRTALDMSMEMPTIESIKRFVQMGMGVAIVPRMCVTWELEQRLAEGSACQAVEHPAASIYRYAARRRGCRIPQRSSCGCLRKT